MRRVAPRPISAALANVVKDAEPATLLARVQALWPEVAGAAVAASAAPTAERDGVLTVTCESAVWAAELELLAPDLLARLNAALEGSATGSLTGLRVGVGSLPNRA